MSISEVLLAANDSLEATVVLKASALLMIGLTVARLSTWTSASARHLMLAATFSALLTLPLVVPMAPRFEVAVPVSSAAAAPPVVSRSVAPESDTPATVIPSAFPEWHMPSWTDIARGIWIGGAGLQVLFLISHLLRLRHIRRAGIPWLDRLEIVQTLAADCGVRKRIDLLLHERIAAPITCGVFQPVILLPFDARSWSKTDLQRALVHELEHVRRFDWATQLAARAAVAIYWFHPLVWMAWRRLCLEAERASDDAVLRDAESTEYAEQLVGLARRMLHTQAQPALGMANRSDLSARVSALLDGTQRRGRTGFFATASVIVVAGVVLFAIAPLTAVAQFTSSQPNGQESRRVSALDRALYEAAEAGDLQDIDALLNAGANVNAVIRGDGSPLIGAARKGNLAAVARLLDRGADPNLPVSGDGNPLIMAAAEGHAHVVSLLLDRGARIDEVVTGDENALIQASGKGQLDVVELLVSRRANVNARLWVNESGVIAGVRGGVIGGVPGGVGSGMPGGVGRGVSGGVTSGVPGVGARSTDGSGEWRSPLNMARKGGHQAVVDFLIRSGARE